MNANKFDQTIEAWRRRIAELRVPSEESPLPQQQLFQEAFEEFHIALEELEMAQEELIHQNEELAQQNQELARVHQTVQAERQRYQDLFEFAPDGYIVTAPEGTILEANCAAASLLNTDQQFLLGKSVLDFVVEQDRLAFQTELSQPRIGDWVREWEVCLIPRDRRPIDVALTVAPERDRAGKQIALRWLLRNINDRKQAEMENARLYREAQEANRIKDEFLAIVSHELRTPLNAILGWAQMLRNRKWNEANITKALEIIERNAKLQGKLIEDILDVSRIVQGQIRLNTRPVHLVPIINAAIQSLRPTAEIKAIQVETILNPNMIQVMGDAERLQQVLWNLLSNAIKFTPVGGRVKVGLEQVNSRARITVSDTGKGIGADFLPYVFEPFRQADATTTRSQNGLGLGLAIVRHLVEMHAGTVYATSAGEGLGATFTVELPIIDLQQQPIPEKQVRFDHLPVLDGLQVLVIDDNADTCELTAVILKECGAQVTAVLSVAEAVDVLTRLKPDVLISDIGMPEEDGYSLIRHVKALEAERGWKFPTIALTAFASEQERDRALKAGFQMHVTKPVEPAQFVTVVANLAGRNLQA